MGQYNIQLAVGMNSNITIKIINQYSRVRAGWCLCDDDDDYEEYLLQKPRWSMIKILKFLILRQVSSCL